MADYLGKETKKVSKEVDGTDIYTYVKGDYFPLTYSATEGNFNWDKQKAQEFGLPDFKSLKDRTRTEGGYVNIAPVTMVTDGYIRRAADYIAFGELADTFGIMDYMHTFGTSTLVDSVKQNMGSEYGAWMENYVKDVQDINQTRGKSNYNGWSKLTRNFQTAVLVGNPGTPFKQKGSMWLAMSELDPRAVAKAAVTSLNPGNQQMKAAYGRFRVGRSSPRRGRPRLSCQQENFGRRRQENRLRCHRLPYRRFLKNSIQRSNSAERRRNER